MSIALGSYALILCDAVCIFVCVVDNVMAYGTLGDDSRSLFSSLSKKEKEPDSRLGFPSGAVPPLAVPPPLSLLSK